MISRLKTMFVNIWDSLLNGNSSFRLGIYGAPNSGKTTLANRMCKDITSNEESSDSDDSGSKKLFSDISNVAHETRKVSVKEKLLINRNGKKMIFDLVDTPGIATRIDYEVFVKAGLTQKEAKQRAREATKGVIESIKWLENVDIVIIMIDATKSPYNQVNLTIVGNLEARKIPFMIVANKTDLKSSKIEKIQAAFPKYKVVGISAKFSQNMDKLYDELLVLKRKVKR
ncbi:MAG TPA: GTP-binding protein [Alphaproteobacteria bacterium]|nr:GTP-binding protein [Alphaproteobacteria bacterium]